MPAPKLTDEEILDLYRKGTPLTRIPAGSSRVDRVLEAHGITKEKQVQFRRKPTHWITKLQDAIAMAGEAPKLADPTQYREGSMKRKLVERNNQRRMDAWQQRWDTARNGAQEPTMGR